MKNTLKIIGIIALTAIIGLSVISCKDAANDVEKVTVTAASRAAWAQLRYTIGANPYQSVAEEYQIIEWKALGKNVSYYEVYLRKNLKDSATAVLIDRGTYGYGFDSLGRSFNPSNDSSFTPVPSTPGVNYNPRTFKDDTWFALIGVNIGDFEPGKYYVGVRAFVTADEYSNIVWSDNTIEIKANIWDTYSRGSRIWADKWLGSPNP